MNSAGSAAGNAYELFILSLSRSYAWGVRVNRGNKLNPGANEMLDVIRLALVLGSLRIAAWYVRLMRGRR
jgi:hypothetical protein